MLNGKRERDSVSVDELKSVDEVVQMFSVAGKYLSHYVENGNSPRLVRAAGLKLLNLLSICPFALPEKHTFFDTPPGVWGSLILQIFALLEHKSLAVRTAVSRLLERLRDSWPELLVPHAVVDAAKTDSRFCAEFSRRLLSDMRKIPHISRVVQETDLLYSACREMTILTDEKWLFKLGSLRNEVAKKSEALTVLCKQLEATEKSIEVKKKYTRGYFEVLIQPIRSSLRALFDEMINQPSPSRMHDVFVKENQQNIKNAIDSLYNLEGNDSVKKAWTPFKEVDSWCIVNRIVFLKVGEKGTKNQKPETGGP